MAIHRIRASHPYLPIFLSANERTIEVTALIDTGASITAVHPAFVAQLEALKIGAVEVSRVGLPSRWEPTYFFTIGLGPDATAFGVEAVGAAPASPCDILIGRDLLSRWAMSWDGGGDRLLLCY